VLEKMREDSDFELVKSGVGNKLLAVVARLCLPPLHLYIEKNITL